MHKKNSPTVEANISYLNQYVSLFFSFLPLSSPKSFYSFCTYNRRTMIRRKVTLRLNENVVKRAKDSGMNLSYFLEVKLVEYLAKYEAPRERFELSLPRRGTGSQGRRGRPDFATSAEI